MQPTAIITETLDDDCARWLSEHCHVIRCAYDDPGFDAALATAEALVVRTYTIVNDALLDKAPKLRVVGRAGVGLDNIDLEACKKRGVRVVHTPDANTQAVVEYVFGLILDHVRPRPRSSLTAQTTAEQFHAMRKEHVGKQLSDLSIGIVGMGRIGKRIATLAHTLGMNTYGCDLLPEAEIRSAIPGVPWTMLDHASLYARSDIVTIHVDGRTRNRYMVDADAMTHFRGDVLFINAARGMLVDHMALADWLKTHPEARAILDVHDPEPPREDYPLFGLDNVWLLPHLASRTDTALKNMSGVVKDVVNALGRGT